MDSRTTTGGSPPSLSLAQMGRALLSSSNNWMTVKWWDLVPEQEVSMMLALLTSLPHHPSNDQPLKPLPHWFHACLWGDHTNFHLLQEVIIALNDWGILAEIQQYQVLDQEVAMLLVESCLVDANLAASQLAKEACKDHLVTVQVAEKVNPVGIEHFKPQIV